MRRPKTRFMNSTPTPKIANYGRKIKKMTPKLSKNQKLELKKTIKINIVQISV